MDIRGANNTLPIKEESRCKTTFWGGDGLYEYNTAPMGRKNSGIDWQQCIDSILEGVVHQLSQKLGRKVDAKVQAYANDAIIASNSSNADHLLLMREVWKRLMEAGVKLPPGKTRLMMKRLPFLGHIIGHHSIAPQFDKIEAINLLHEPSNVGQLRSFLGMTQYYNHFIPNFHMVRKPLTVLLQKTT